MGCASSKRIEATKVDIYRPAPASFAVFDINSVEEPWLTGENTNVNSTEQEKQSNHVPGPILEKLNKLETDFNGPNSWEDVSKALEDLKTSFKGNQVIVSQKQSLEVKKQSPVKSSSFHTLEELEKKIEEGSKPVKDLKKTQSAKPESTLLKTAESKTESKTETKTESPPPRVTEGFKSLKDNIFIVRDRLEKEKEGKNSTFIKRDPLSDFPAKCPPTGADSLVVYTTSLRGVRRTYEACARVRDILELHGVVFDERDVSLHAEFLSELRELLGEEGVGVPRVFVKGRYIGGADDLGNLNDSGRLGRILRFARVETGMGWRACEGCGGARFIPCLDCGGSCKVIGDSGVKERCGICNENGLVRCPACA